MRIGRTITVVEALPLDWLRSASDDLPPRSDVIAVTMCDLRTPDAELVEPLLAQALP